ncbi:MAG: penicillin acylase family protein [Candidatus Neomarinimicrobiota bacterium]
MNKFHWKPLPKNIIGIGIAGVSALLILAAVIFYGYIDLSENRTAGEAVVGSLADNVEILVGPDGVPHISAENTADLFRAIGYVQAGRNLFEMDRLLRIATGRMAAVRGKKFVKMDIAARQIGFRYLARKTLIQLSPETRLNFIAYCEGVNAFIDGHHHATARQFRLSGYEPLKWEPVDCLAILNLYRWLYTSQWNEKIVLYKTVEIFGAERTADGFPLADRWITPAQNYKTAFFPMLDALYQNSVDLRQFVGLIPGRDELVSGAIAGSKSLSNQATLVVGNNFFSPEQWALDLTTPDYRLCGLFVPGTPICIAGNNRHVAWSLNLLPDPAVDFVAVRIDPRNNRYLNADGWRDIIRQHEQIKIKNRRDRTADFYHSDQGVILDYPAITADSTVRAIALNWPGVSAVETDSWIAIMLAQNPNELFTIDQKMAASIAELVFTDEAGQCGIVPNDHPVFTGIFQPNLISNSLTGFGTSDSLLAQKFRLESQSGYVYPHYRYGRTVAIERELGQTAQITAQEMITFGGPDVDPYADKILANVRETIADTNFTWATELQAYRRMIAWDGHYADNSVGATIYRVFAKTLIRNIYADEMDLVDSITCQQFMNAYDFAMQNLVLLIERGESPWFDDLQTPDTAERQGEIIRKSFRETVHGLEEQYSANLSEWQWGRVGRDFQISKNKANYQPTGVVRTVIMNAAGQASGFFMPAGNPEETTAGRANLFCNRSELVRDGAKIVLLKARAKNQRE